MPERRELETVKPLGQSLDLVFVLGFTQCTALMVARPLWAMIAYATSRYGDSRYRLRHGLDLVSPR